VSHLDLKKFAARRLRLLRTVNEALQDSGILHAVFLERLKTNEVNRIVSFLNDEVFPEVASKLEMRLSRIASRGYDSNAWKTKQYKEMLLSINELIRVGLRSARNNLKKSLAEMGVYEASYQRDMIRHAMGESMGIELVPNIVSPAPMALRSIITSKPFEVRLLKDWWSSLEKATQKAVESQINIGIATGDPTHRIVQRITGTATHGFTDGVMNTTRRHAETVVRTSVNHIMTQAREMTYKENKKVVKGVRYVATLDSRTTDICIALDGQVFGIFEGPRPPMHHQCRSTTVPIIKSWKELGIKNLREMPSGMRASMNGQVPAKMTYGQWLKKQPKKIQNEVLGAGKASLFRRGTVPIERFIDNKFRPLTLEQLKRLERKRIRTGGN